MKASSAPLAQSRSAPLRRAGVCLSLGLLVTLGACASLPGSPSVSPGATEQPAAPAAGAASATPDTARGPAPTAAPNAGPRARPLQARRVAAPARPESDEGELPRVDLTPQIVFQLLASEIAAQRGQGSSATATYLSLAQKTRDPRLARRATELALADRSLDRALLAAQLWRELAPGSAIAAQTLETLWLSTGRLKEARPLLEQRLAKARAEGTVGEAYDHLARVLLRGADKAAALALLDELAAADPQVPQARLAQAALAQASGQADRAAIDAGRALALRPEDENTVVQVAGYLQNSSAGTPAALRVLAAYLERFPKAVDARFHYARMLAGSGRADDARREMEVALKADPDSPAILYALAQLAYQARQLPVAADYLTRLVELPTSVPRDNGPAYLFLAQIAEESRQLPRAIAWLEKVTQGEQAMPALLRRAVLISKSGDVERARELLRNTTASTNRERVQLIAVEAQVLREANRGVESFEVLDRALERLPNNPELLYDHAMAAERLDRVEVMETSLRKLIQIKPDNAHAYNALGYSLAERGLRLEEAQALIEKALQLMPEDAHILDSMGWVLFRRGENERALEYLRRAYALRPEAEIAAHLGEVLWKLGRADEARRLWAEARGREPDNQTLKETLARLNVAL